MFEGLERKNFSFEPLNKVGSAHATVLSSRACSTCRPELFVPSSSLVLVI